MQSDAFSSRAYSISFVASITLTASIGSMGEFGYSVGAQTSGPETSSKVVIPLIVVSVIGLSGLSLLPAQTNSA